jgi:cytochrome b561
VSFFHWVMVYLLIGAGFTVWLGEDIRSSVNEATEEAPELRTLFGVLAFAVVVLTWLPVISVYLYATYFKSPPDE